MNHSSLHVHTIFCDGNNTPEEMVLAAIGAGMKTLGFSAHAAWPFASEWHLAPRRYEEYTEEISRLKIKYGERITILCGFEADWIPGVTAPDPEVYKRFSPDYLIGSVHYVPADDRIARNAHQPLPLWAVDASAKDVSAGIDACFGGDGKRAAQAYWSTVRDMITTCSFDIIGHLDVLRKRNGTLKFFDENASWYERELKATAQLVARSGKITEINTGAIARKTFDGVYPSDPLLALLRKHDVPIIINSDAHSAGDLICAYDRAREAAQRAGYTEIVAWSPQGWITEKI